MDPRRLEPERASALPRLVGDQGALASASIGIEESMTEPESGVEVPESTAVIDESPAAPESTGVDVSAVPESTPLVESATPPLSVSGLAPPELLLEQPWAAISIDTPATPTTAWLFQRFFQLFTIS